MTITLTREEAQQVLEHLDDLVDAQQWEIDMHSTQYGEGYKPQRMKHMKEQLANTNKTIELLRTRLAQPESEPIAYKVGDATVYIKPPIYTAPPQREWQGLTDDERTYLAWESNNGPHCVAMTEALLKEKNNG